MTEEELVEVLWQRVQSQLPPALLIGTAPDSLQKYNYVNERPYEAVVIGELSPSELLQMPTEPVCQALLEGMPVYLWRKQPFLRAKKGILLKRHLQAQMDRLLLLGISPLSTDVIARERSDRGNP